MLIRRNMSQLADGPNRGPRSSLDGNGAGRPGLAVGLLHHMHTCSVSADISLTLSASHLGVQAAAAGCRTAAVLHGSQSMLPECGAGV